MFATQSEITPQQKIQRPTDYFGENPDVASIYQKGDCTNFSFARATWAFNGDSYTKQVNTVALVSVYKTLAHHLKRLAGTMFKNHAVKIIDNRIVRQSKN